MAEHSAQLVKPAQAPQNNDTTTPREEEARSSSAMWYMWRGQLFVGFIDVGSAILWSENVTCIPAL